MPVRNPTPPEFLSRQISSARRFYFRKPGKNTANLTVYCAGVEHCSPDYFIERRSFPYFALEMVVGGKGSLLLNGQEAVLGPGLIFTYGGEIAHQITSSKEHPLLKYFVNFCGHEAENLLHTLKLTPGALCSVEASAEVRDFFENLVIEGMGNRRHSPRLCALLCEALLWKIAENRVNPREVQSEAYLTYVRCREIVASEYLQISNLTELSRRCSLDPAYLCRLYKKYDHETPYAQLQRLRMSHAAKLLSYPGILVKHAAQSLGIADVFHFSRAFKRLHGLSPRDFQNTLVSGSL